MNLEDQVAPLALAQRMKELGFPQETLAAWVTEGDDPRAMTREEIAFDRDSSASAGVWQELCAAPTVAEMGEWLPGYATSCKMSPDADHRWEAEDDILEAPEEGATEAEARARLCIHLAEFYAGMRADGHVEKFDFDPRKLTA